MKNVVNPHKTLQEHLEKPKIAEKRKQSLKVISLTNRKKFLSQTEKHSNLSSHQKSLIPILQKKKSEVTILRSILPDYYSTNSRIKTLIGHKNNVSPKANNYRASPPKSQQKLSYHYINPLNENTFKANDQSFKKSGRPSNPPISSFDQKRVTIDPNTGEELTSDSQFSDETQDLDFSYNDSDQDQYEIYQIPRSVVTNTESPLSVDEREYSFLETKLKKGTIGDRYDEEYGKHFNNNCKLKPLLEQLIERLNLF